MNRTLVKLARVMLAAFKLPQFLWEPAVLHAAYLRNMSYTKVHPRATPYQIWYGIKPNVEHLHEFGAPVWILLQGQNVQKKMLPKSQRHIYVRYDEGLHSVKYYNLETRNIQLLRNYKYLNLHDPCPMHDVVIEPPPPAPNSPLHEGELGIGMQHTVVDKGKRKADEDIDPRVPQRQRTHADPEPQEPQKTRGIHVDYQYLNDPFTDEEEAGVTIVQEQAFTVVPRDECHSLHDTRESPEWPEWEAAIHDKLDQLKCMGTWQLVDKPVGAVPISNKWVFTKKRNKEGVLTRYKARLIAKGCAQCPGYNYLETHSLVVLP